jgi:hypothetical protein
MYWGAPEGGAVFGFWTLTKRSCQPSGRTAVSRSTPSMLKPYCSSNGDHSPATPSMRSARAAVSSLWSASGSMSISRTWWLRAVVRPP